MPSPITVRGLGLGGVNLVKSPLDMADDELIQAQNAEPYRERGVAGIRKRSALRPINSSALSAIEGIVPAELMQSGAGDVLDGPGRDGVAGTVYVLYGTTWKYTIDGGVNWAAILDSLLGLFTYGSAGLGPAATTTARADRYQPSGSSTGNYTDGVVTGSSAGAVLGQTPVFTETEFIEIATVGNKRSITLDATTRSHVAHSSGDTHAGTATAISIGFYMHLPSTASGSATVQVFVRISGTDYDIGSPITMDKTDNDGNFTSVSSSTNPATSSAWTFAGIEGAEYGIRIATNTAVETIRVTGLIVSATVNVTTGGL